MSRTRRPLSAVEALRNTRRSLGDGTIAGRNRLAAPYQVGRVAGDVVVAAGESPRGETVALTGTVTYPVGGGETVASLDTIQAQHGMTSVDAAGDPVTLPLPAVYLAEVDIRYTDGYRGGGTVEVELNGTTIGAVWPSSGPWGRWVGQVAFAGSAGDDFDVQVNPDDGEQHDAVVTLRVSLLEPLRTIAATVPIIQAVFIGVDSSTDYVAALEPAVTVATAAVGPSAVNPSGATMVDRAGVPTLYIGDRAGRVWETQTLPPTDTSDWSVSHDLSDGSLQIVELATDGTKIRAMISGMGGGMAGWLVSDDAGATWARQSDFAVPAVASGGRVYYNNGIWWRGVPSSTAGVDSFQTSADGDSWNTVTYPGSRLTSMAFATTQVGVASDYELLGDRIWTTADGGSNWTLASMAGTAMQRPDMVFVDRRDQLYVVRRDNANVYIARIVAGVVTDIQTITTLTGSSATGEGRWVHAGDARIVVTFNRGWGIVSDDDGDTWTAFHGDPTHGQDTADLVALAGMT